MNKLFLGTYEDKSYLAYLKSYFNGHVTYTVTDPVDTLMQLQMYCSKRNINGVVSTNKNVLIKLLALQGNNKTSVSLDDYSGSLFTYQGIEIVFIKPLKQFFTVSYGKFLAARFISKITRPQEWRESTKFVWEVGTPENFERLYELYKSAFLIGFDLETFKDPLSIRCAGFTAVFVDKLSNLSSHSIVIPLTDSFNLSWVRRFCLLPAPKVTQNGKYDINYCLRFNIIVHNWVWDTAHLFHSWFAELPKDLAFINAFAMRKAQYWKDLAETNDLQQYYKYNAMDHWATVNAAIALIDEMPPWALRNYVLEFPVNFPSILYEMTGVKRNEKRLLEKNAEVEAKISDTNISLCKEVGFSKFNANSPPQVKKLLTVLGCKDLAEVSSDEIHLKKAILRHPVNQRILTKILDIRGWRKLNSTYLTIKDEDHEPKEFHGRILSAMNPHGTDTARNASKSHHFWCGMNIQNIPIRDGPIVRETVQADPDFLIGECDLSKAESWDTAFISGSPKMIAAVSSPQDFHSINAAMFFGIAYEKIFDDIKKKILDKKLRYLSKRTNHGATYVMGPQVLIDTMGEDKIAEARTLLKLPKFWTLIQVAEHLLACFHKAYPDIAQKYYPWVVKEVTLKKMLVSSVWHDTEYNRTYHPDFKTYIEEGDWTRYCFGNPAKTKRDLNSYVAHGPQSLNARTLNEAYILVMNKVALPNAGNFKLGPQIHDSIFFQFRKGFLHLAHEVKKCMEIKVHIKSIDGVYREFTVPADLKLGKDGQGAEYWSDTE
jgi:DNA polymerase I-like protein with 3'-5' exonuclease and polymerase domains